MRIERMRPGGRKWVLLLALGLAACAPPTDAELIQSIEEGMQKVPGSEFSFGEMKREFPLDYKALMDSMVVLARQSASNAEVEAQSATFMRSFIRGIANDAVKAPAPELEAYREEQIALLKTLRRQSVAFCARMSLGEDLPSDAPARPQRIALGKAQAAYFKAAAAGRRTPVTRSKANTDDFRALGRALSAGGLSDEDILTLDTPGRLAMAGPETQCRIGIATYTAVGTLPGPASERLTVMLVGPPS